MAWRNKIMEEINRDFPLLSSDPETEDERSKRGYPSLKSMSLEGVEGLSVPDLLARQKILDELLKIE